MLFDKLAASKPEVQMPLSDFIHTLNSAPTHAPTLSVLKNTGLDQPFVSRDGRIFIHYANIRLDSQFLPIVETSTGKPFGHSASVLAHGLSNNTPMTPEAVFVLPSDDEEFVYLDRLVRTLHALNYLTRPTQGNLVLSVHARHVMSVPTNHGLAFEEILRPCGLLPKQVTLEIDAGDVVEQDHFIQAVANYRTRGFGVSIGQFGRTKPDYGFLGELQPDIVKLSPRLTSAIGALPRVVEKIHQQGIRVMIDMSQTADPRLDAEICGIDLRVNSRN
jgi:EAL domain-containing protein (putative c-di-GMP-specific phosphodiesterase class I)